MRWLSDAQLPRRLALLLNQQGHDAIHTLELPQGNQTPDAEIIAVADCEARVVVTKDADFVSGFVLHNRPRQLLPIATGNITNQELLDLLLRNRPTIEASFAACDFLELARDALIAHS